MKRLIFYLTFNAMANKNKQIIISADKAPTDIHPSTKNLRLGILQAKHDQLQVTVTNSVLEFLALKETSNNHVLYMRNTL